MALRTSPINLKEWSRELKKDTNIDLKVWLMSSVNKVKIKLGLTSPSQKNYISEKLKKDGEKEEQERERQKRASWETTCVAKVTLGVELLYEKASRDLNSGFDFNVGLTLPLKLSMTFE